MPGTPSDIGPSYWDASNYAEELRARFGVGLLWEVVPPIKTAHGGYTKWRVGLHWWYLGKGDRMSPVHGRGFGAGTDHKTFSGALYATLVTLWNTLEEREQTAAQRAAF